MRILSLLSAALWIALPACAINANEDIELNPTLGLEPPEGAVVLFDGSDLSKWTQRDGSEAGWPVEDDAMTVGRGDIKTTDEFGAFQLHVEFQCPHLPDKKGQARGNSGVYLQGKYEVQVLDSYGLEMQANDCGAIYQQVVPRVNACLPPLEWQSFDITFHPAKVEDGEVVQKARVTVVHNGVTTIENAEIDPTPGGVSMEPGGTGPILLQDHGDEVKFRNIWLVPID